MALNFLGVGLNFTGDDKGLTDAAEHSTDSLQKMMGVIGQLGEKFSRIGDLSRQGRALTTSFENMLQQNRKANIQGAYAMGAAYDELGKIASKAQSIELSTGISSQAATESIVSFRRSVDDLTKAGFKNEEQFMKIVEVTKTSPQEYEKLANTMKRLGITSKEAMTDLMGGAMAAGRAMGSASAGLSQLGTTLESTLSRVVSNIGDKTPEALAKYAKQVSDMTVGLSKLGFMGTDAGDAVSDLFVTGTKNGKEFAKIFSGLNSDIPQLPKSLAILGADTDAAFRKMGEGPKEMFDGLVQQFKTVKANGGDGEAYLRFMSHYLEEAGYQTKTVENLINTISKSTQKQLDQMTSESVNGAKEIEQAGKAWRTSLTDAQQLANMEDVFHTRFRSLAKSNQQYLAETSAAFKDLGDELGHLSKQGGPLGSFVDKLAEVDKKGLIGLMPASLQATATAVGGFATSIGGALLKMASPLSMAESAFTLFGTAFVKAFEGTDRNQSLADRAAQALTKVGTWLEGWLADLPGIVSKGLDDALSYVKEMFSPKGKNGKMLGDAATGLWSTVTTSFKMIFSQTNLDKMGEIWKEIGPVISRSWDSTVSFIKDDVWPKITAFGSDLWAQLTAAVDPSKSEPTSMGGKIGKALRGAWDAVKPEIEKLWTYIKEFGTDLWGGIANAFTPGQVFDKDTMGGKIGTAIGAALNAGIELLGPIVSKGLSKLWDSVTDAIGQGLLKLLATKITIPGLGTLPISGMAADAWEERQQYDAAQKKNNELLAEAEANAMKRQRAKADFEASQSHPGAPNASYSSGPNASFAPAANVPPTPPVATFSDPHLSQSMDTQVSVAQTQVALQEKQLIQQTRQNDLFERFIGPPGGNAPTPAASRPTPPLNTSSPHDEKVSNSTGGGSQLPVALNYSPGP